MAVFACIQKEVVVASDDDLDRVRLSMKPRYCCLEFLEGARLGQVTSVDKNIAVWEFWLAVVCVRDADDRDRVHERLGGHSPSPGVEFAGEEDAWSFEKLLPETGTWPVNQSV